MTDWLNEECNAARESKAHFDSETPLREDEAAYALGFSRTKQFHKAWLNGRAPRPVNLDGVLRWRENDIYTWLVRDANR